MKTLKNKTAYSHILLVIVENSESPYNFIRCWCFDCKQVFFADGNEKIGATTCFHCGGKNYDFDIDFRYTNPKKGRKEEE